MSRPRAGRGSTTVSKYYAGRWHYKIFLIDDNGNLVHSIAFKGAPRCKRCRRPTLIVFGDGLCNTCYYYKFLSTEEFWNRKGDYFFPYNIGRRSTNATVAQAEEPSHS